MESFVKTADACRFLSVSEAAKRLDMSPKFIRRLCHQGLLGPKCGNRWRIDAARLQEWVEANTPSSAGEREIKHPRASQRRVALKYFSMPAA
jgi:excisionase family DNA binding protein